MIHRNPRTLITDLTTFPLLEKIEEAKAKAAIKAQIEADKKARAERTAKEKALREGKEWTDAGAVDKPGTSAANGAGAASSGVKGADYKETRLQVSFFSLDYFKTGFSGYVLASHTFPCPMFRFEAAAVHLLL